MIATISPTIGLYWSTFLVKKGINAYNANEPIEYCRINITEI